ncbi:MAG: hypothetical protein HEQ32_07450 [Vampirovibrio sp.]
MAFPLPTINTASFPPPSIEQRAATARLIKDQKNFRNVPSGATGVRVVVGPKGQLFSTTLKA